MALIQPKQIPASRLKQVSNGVLPGFVQTKQIDVAAPVLVVSNGSHGMGLYAVGDDIVFEVTVSTDLPFTGVDIYESGSLVGVCTEDFPGLWVLTLFDVAAGAKSYTARLTYVGGYAETAAVAFTVEDDLDPTEITSATALAWWKTPESLQYGTTLLHTAGTGPAVTLSGALTQQPYGWQMKITAGGARGTATYAISHDNTQDNYTAQTGTTAATVNDGATGIVVNFPTGTYVNTDVYKAVLVQLNDQIGANTLSNGTSPQRPFPFSGLFGGYTAARFDGSDDRYNCTTGLTNTATGGVNNSHTVFLLIRVAALPGVGVVATVFRFGSTTTNQVASELRIKGGSTCFWEVIRRDSAGNTVTLTSVIPATLGEHVLCLRFDGSSVNVRDNGQDVIGGIIAESGVSGAGFGTAATVTVNNLSVFAQNSAGTTTSFLSGDLYDMSVLDGYVSDSDTVRHERYY